MNIESSSFNKCLRNVIYWFDLLMFVLAYIGIYVSIAGKGLDWVIVMLSIAAVLYTLVKGIYFARSDK